MFEQETTASKSRNNPFYGWPLKGKAVITIVGGEIVWHEQNELARV
jgi:dihydroorotase-like cyclic amidohydrolase